VKIIAKKDTHTNALENEEFLYDIKFNVENSVNPPKSKLP